MRRIKTILFAFAVTGSFRVPAEAAVVALDASVSTTVQELIEGQPASINADDDALDPDGENLPLLASADIVTTDLGGALVAHGLGFSVFADPARLDQPNPEEFALESACFSNATFASYIVVASTQETRTVRFTRSEINFNLDGTRRIESSLFLSGAVVVWSTSRDLDLTGLEAELTATVSRSGTTEPLLETGLTVTADDSGALATDSSGPLEFEVVALDELAERGLDEATRTVLEQIAEAGSLLVLAIPLQEHGYLYTVRADQSLNLTAQLDITLRGVAGGVGLAATFGRPFSELADFVEESLPGADGELLQKSINDAVAARDSTSSGDSIGPIPALCGALGFEAMIMIAAPLALGLASRRFGP